LGRFWGRLRARFEGAAGGRGCGAPFDAAFGRRKAAQAPASHTACQGFPQCPCLLPLRRPSPLVHFVVGGAAARGRPPHVLLGAGLAHHPLVARGAARLGACGRRGARARACQGRRAGRVEAAGGGGGCAAASRGRAPARASSKHGQRTRHGGERAGGGDEGAGLVSQGLWLGGQARRAGRGTVSREAGESGRGRGARADSPPPPPPFPTIS
jgi:hypothetical protein